MNRLRYILVALLILVAGISSGAEAHAPHDGGVDVKKIIFEHVKDSYEWHITTVGDKHISISLPVIIYSENSGWEVFLSSVFHENDTYK